MTSSPDKEWFLVFYSVPSHPVSIRMKIWRKLAKTGAVPLKGAVYVLPASEEHQEFLQWLIGEVKSVGGDGAFVRTAAIETMDDTDIRELFRQQVGKEYRGLEKNLAVLERQVSSVRKGTKLKSSRDLNSQAARIANEFREIGKRDFFASRQGTEIRKRIEQLDSALKSLGASPASEQAAVPSKRPEQYRGRTWITRKRPFVDRMASAWLIKRFIDPAAEFRFIDEKDLGRIGPEAAAFDMKGAEFTHHGELCTFETLIKAFGVRDRAVLKIAEVVHDLDLKDEKYGNAGAAGVEEILNGIRKSVKSDSEALDRGMEVFEMLYRSVA